MKMKMHWGDMAQNVRQGGRSRIRRGIGVIRGKV